MTLSRIDLGKKIKEARKLKSERIGRKYTGQHLANDLNLSRGYIGDIESGRKYPSYELLTAIANVCNIPLSFFEESEDNNLDTANDITHNPIENNAIKFDNATDAIKFILKQPTIMGYGGFDVNKLSNEEIVEFANELLNQLQLLGYKYKK